MTWLKRKLVDWILPAVLEALVKHVKGNKGEARKALKDSIK